MQQRIKDGFSILLLAAYATRLFGERLKISRIGAVPQAHRRLHLILNLSAQLDSDTPIINETTNREAAPELLQFGRAFPHILQAVWGADPVQGPVRVSKLDVMDAYHHGTVKPAQVGTSAYVIPSAPEGEGKIICINLVLPMGWVYSPMFFCVFSETLTDMANALVDTHLPVPSYGAISEITATRPGAPHTPESLTHIDCYIDDLISAVQEVPDRQH